ncbi:MAG: hypothetical protein JO334_11520 [Verrucomicrobia bacterium]|nr:hypothetical protein [Verrucomicrobiota bacterium]
MRPDDRLRSPLTIALEPVTVDPGTLYDSILTDSADQIHSRIHNILVDKALPPVGIFAPGTWTCDPRFRPTLRKNRWGNWKFLKMMLLALSLSPG